MKNWMNIGRGAAVVVIALGIASTGAMAKGKPGGGGSLAKIATDFGNCGTPGVFDAGFSYIACSGGYDKNVLGNSDDAVATQIDGLAKLGLSYTPETFDFNSFFKIGSLGGGDAVLPASETMYGITIFGIHFGGGSALGNATAFYKFDAGKGTNVIPIATNGSSGFVLYDTGTEPSVDVVPEPATWAMMIAGFGLVGAAMRRRTGLARVAA